MKNKLKQKVILQFINYSPRIYSGFDKYNVLLAEKLVSKGYLTVFVFSESTDAVPAIATDLEAVGAKLELIPAKGKWQISIAIWRLYAKYKPEIVHTHFVEYAKALTALFSLVRGVKHYTSFHSTISLLSAKDYVKKKGVLKRISLYVFYSLLLASSNKILTVSEAIKGQFLDFAVTHSDRVQKLYLGVDLKKNRKGKEELKTSLHLPKNRVLLCNISAFEFIKGLDILCEAVAILKNEYKQENFLFCHLGGLRAENEFNKTYRDSIYTLAKELDIENEISWMGHRNDIDEIVSAFDIYVHPSRMEGLPVAIMEAATQSLPIIGTNVGGIPEIVHDGENGYLFESENVTQLAQKMYQLLANKALREEMGKESLHIASEHFEIEHQVEMLIALYQIS